MQIRQSGQRIQFLRTYYVADLKRSKQTLLGSVQVGATELPAALAAKLTQEERDQFAVYVEKEQAAARSAQIAQEIETLPQALRDVAGHVMRGAQLTPAQAKGMWEGMAQLRRQLTKAGYTKPHLNDSPTTEGMSNEGSEADS